MSKGATEDVAMPTTDMACSVVCFSTQICRDNACIACGSVGEPCCVNDKCTFGTCVAGTCSSITSVGDMQVTMPGG
ncbi:MAG TPA: hypothetical protein VIA18_09055 [Polyangia bacterium]|nr:hypothetical protein [Polyangia bacterium]